MQGRDSLFVLDHQNKLKLNIRAKKITLPPISEQKNKSIVSKVKNFLGLKKKVSINSTLSSFKYANLIYRN